MAKYSEIAEKYKVMLNTISSSESEWKNFLDFMSKFSKYEFRDVALIYAQKPDATACAGIDVWNKKMNCWIKKGTKGIALLNDKTGSKDLRYVFDVSDVTPAKTIGRLPNPWVYDERDRESVLTALEEQFGAFRTNDGSLVEDVISLSEMLVKEYSEAILTDIRGRVNGAITIPDDILKVKIEDFLSTSFTHVVLSRLGVDKAYWEELLDYSYIQTFNIDNVLNTVGEYLSGLTMPVLNEIGLISRKNEIERLKTEQYTVLNKEEYNNERGEKKGHDETDLGRSGIHASGRRSPSESQGSGGTEGAATTIRNTSEELPQREPEAAIFNIPHGRESQISLFGDTERGGRNDGEPYRENGEGREYNGRNETERSNGLGSSDELYKRQGDGDSYGGDNNEIDENQLSFFNNENVFIPEQAGEITLNAVDVTVSNSTAFSFNEEIFDVMLRSGTNRVNSLPRIFEKYAQGLSSEEIIEFLSNEYFYDDITIKGFYFNNEPYSFRATEKGLIISKGTSARENAANTMFYTYSEVEERIRVLIENGEYVDRSIAEKSLEIELNDVADKLCNLYWNNGFSNETFEKFSSYPDRESYIREKLNTISGINEMIKIMEASRDNGDSIRFRLREEYSFERIYNRLQNLKRERVSFKTSEEKILVPLSSFITQDAIDLEIKRTHVDGERKRVYKFFTDPNNCSKEKAEFIKNERGTGGHTAANNFSADFDSRGITIKSPNNVEPFTEVTLKWSAIAKRIDELIRLGEYVNSEDIERWAEENNLKNMGLSYISQFLSDEFDNTEEEIADSLKDTRRIPIAYSTSEWDDEIQVYIDLENAKAIFEISNENDFKVFEKDYISLRDLVTNDLAYNDFGAWISMAEDFIREDREKEVPKAPEENRIIDFNIEWSEHPCFYGIPVNNARAQNISFALANRLLGILDAKNHVERDIYDDCGGYYKTSFNFKVLIDGEEHTYEGRYDLGDNHTDLVNHIRLYNEWILKPENAPILKMNGEEEYLKNVAGKRLILDTIIPFLETQTELTPEEEQELQNILATETDWWSRKRLNFIPEEMRDGFDITITVSEEEYRNIIEKDAPFVREIASDSPDKRVLALKVDQALDLLHAIGKAHADQVIEEEIVITKEEIENNANKNNYVITEDVLGAGTKSQKIENNIQAIKLLKRLEESGETPSDDLKDVFSKYVGWGGLSEVFEPTHPRYSELLELLTEEEYESARESTLTSHYTNPLIIRSIYSALERMGFKGGNILEPATGIGHFFGMLPENLSNSSLYGVELDSISGRIAKMLYPDANITISGFEHADEVIRDNFFDVAIGNVPFGDYTIYDNQYNTDRFLVHDYFISKSLDKVKPGGVVALITSSGTLDKMQTRARKTIASKAELLGAIRLPNNAFNNAGTEVTSDIIFLKKRDRQLSVTPSWVDRAENEDGIIINQYFVDNPNMILGKMERVSGRFGMTETCSALEGADLKKQLEEALLNLEENVLSPEIIFDELESEREDVIPADPNVKNYSYTVVDEKVYFRVGSYMEPEDVDNAQKNRIVGLIGIRDAARELINIQLKGCTDEEFDEKREKLNVLYDSFVEKYGCIQDKKNQNTFSRDESYYLLSSLEEYDADNKYIGKADIFSKRTIRPNIEVTHVETAHEALALSIANRATVDLSYMSRLTDLSEAEIVNDLKGVIFSDPESHEYLTADEYLSGNVREKLRVAEEEAKLNPDYEVNVNALRQVQPKDLEAQDIDISLGAIWIPTDVIKDFIRETFNPSYYALNQIRVSYSEFNASWKIDGKRAEYNNPLIDSTYGTSRLNALQILEKTLNLSECKVFDYFEEDGKKKQVLNVKETTLAIQKRDALCDAFHEWVYSDVNRRERLCKIYNERFNSYRAREYDGSYLNFVGMNYEIEMKPYQKNAIARQIYGGNTLLAHCVGAGKTYEMVAAAMEMKRLGLCNKSLFVVPNSLVGQWASEFLKLYPNANVLAATENDFKPANRKKFCSRIATGDYDAVIIPQSQFQTIPLSPETEINFIQDEIDDTLRFIAEEKFNSNERFTIKEMEKTKKRLEARLNQLMEQKKDDVITFEELGIDRLFVDESHNYKNLFTMTKLGRVPGISTTNAKKSQDLYMKCKYLHEITGNKGVIFATGTPISNSMTELYTNMRYLEPKRLEELGLGSFDAWASTFGEVITAIELSPEGTYRSKRRFSKFHNLPELITLFKEIADIQTADMLNLPVPKAEYETVVLPPSELQEEYVKSFSVRADKIRNKQVDPSIDNMLKVTTDGRKVALDQRILNAEVPESITSKTSACVEKAFEIYKESEDIKGTQLIFSDLATPNSVMEFNVYTDIRDKLIAKGVPEKEIAFIHDYNTFAKKEKLFGKVNSGEVRFLLGSTTKLGTGTNVQNRLVALHHLDVPWRPSDIEQREGRILRQGNMNDSAKIFKYVTENTFDSYSWQTIENKQKFIGQVMTSKSPVRSCSDIDETALSYAEVKALAAGNPLIKEKMELDIEVAKLKLARANHQGQIFALQKQIAQELPNKISKSEEYIKGYKHDLELYNKNHSDELKITVNGTTYDSFKEAGEAINDAKKNQRVFSQGMEIGDYLGFKMILSFDSFDKSYSINLKGMLSHHVSIGSDPVGTVTRLKNKLESLPETLKNQEERLDALKGNLEKAKIEVEKSFPQEEEFREKSKRLHELDAILEVEKGDGEVLSDKDSETESEYGDEVSEGKGSKYSPHEEKDATYSNEEYDK